MKANKVQNIWVVRNDRHSETIGAYLNKQDAVEAAKTVLDDYNCDVEDYAELEENAAALDDYFYAGDLVFAEKVTYFF